MIKLAKGAATDQTTKLRAKLAEWNDADFASDVTKAEIQGAHPVSTLLLYTITAFFVLALLWAWWATIDEVTHGEGKVIPSSQVQVVQNLEGGILKEVFIHEGEVVEAEQVIVRIDDTGLASSFGELKANRYATMARIARLTAEADGTPLIFPPELMAEARDVALAEEKLMLAREENLRTQISILRGQADQRRQEVAELQARVSQARNSLSLVEQELAITKPLADQGIAPKVSVLRLQREVSDLRGSINTSLTTLPRAEAAIREANQRIEEKFQAFRAEARQEMARANADLSASDENMKGARDRVNRTDVRSPVRGVVKRIHLTTLGGVIRPGMDLVEIVPMDDTLLVEAKVRPADVAFIHPGQEAVVKFSAYDFSIYGGLKGKLERISADTIIDETQKNETYYKIVVRTEKNYLERAGQKLPIMPGMVTTVDILTGERSILDYMLKPLTKARERALRER